MKKPKLDFKAMYWVQDWATEIVEGYGIDFPHIDLYEKKSCVLLYTKNTLPMIVNSYEVFDNRVKAEAQLTIERRKKKEYYENQIKEATETLKKLK